MNRKRTLSLLAVALVAAGGAAFAAKQVENDALHIPKANIPLAQAVTSAEQHAKGQAVRAEYEHSKQGWVYEVEVVSGTKVFDVRVDPDKGAVLSSTEDKADSDDEHDQED